MKLVLLNVRFELVLCLGFLTTFLIKESTSTSAPRILSASINPGCIIGDGCESWKNLSLIHVTSDSPTDRIHFIWSFIGSPSLIMARTPLDTNLTVNWQYLINGSESGVDFIGKTYYTFGWSLIKVWMFSDFEDKVQMNKVNQSEVFGYETKYFLWERQNDTVINNKTVKLNFKSNIFNKTSIGEDGYFEIKIAIRGEEGYGEEMPFMLSNGNTSHIDISFVNVKLNFPDDNPPNPRLGLNYVFVEDQNDKGLVNDTIKIVTTESLDDEHSPGVFKLFNLITPIVGQYDQCFIQWRPICYTTSTKDVTDSIDVWSYNVTYENTDKTPHIKDSLLWSFYGSQINYLLLQSTNISFGTQQDGFYNKTNHASWTYLSGFGEPPRDKVSFTIILVLALGLGIPLLIIIAAAVYGLLKRLSSPRDDLLLGS